MVIAIPFDVIKNSISKLQHWVNVLRFIYAHNLIPAFVQGVAARDENFVTRDTIVKVICILELMQIEFPGARFVKNNKGIAAFVASGIVSQNSQKLPIYINAFIKELGVIGFAEDANRFTTDVVEQSHRYLKSISVTTLEKIMEHINAHDKAAMHVLRKLVNSLGPLHGGGS